jgi:hypothetical protein
MTLGAPAPSSTGRSPRLDEDLEVAERVARALAPIGPERLGQTPCTRGSGALILSTQRQMVAKRGSLNRGYCS